MTYQNLGYWIGQANDLSTGSHPTGWTNGQRWSESAGEWQAMYGTSQSSLASMTSDRDYWKTTVAHDDPNVWTNRYNAGYSAGNTAGYTSGYAQATTDKQPAALTVYSVGIGAQNCSGADHEIAGFNVGITGQYMVSFMVGLNNVGSGNQWCNLKVNVGGVGQVIYITTALSLAALISRGGAYWQGAITAGQRVSLTAGNNGSSNGEGGLVAAFIPTPAQPH